MYIKIDKLHTIIGQKSTIVFSFTILLSLNENGSSSRAAHLSPLVGSVKVINLPIPEPTRRREAKRCKEQYLRDSP